MCQNLAIDSNVLNAIMERLSACAELHSKSKESSRVLDSLEGTVGVVKGLLDNGLDSGARQCDCCFIPLLVH